MSSPLGAGSADRPGTEVRESRRAVEAEVDPPGADQLPPAEPSPPPSAYARAGARRFAAWLLRWGLGPVLAVLCLAAVLVGGRFVHPAAPPSAVPAPPAVGASAGGASLQPSAIESRADASAAQAAAGQAADAVQSARALLSAAAADLRTVTAMASARQARQPGAEDPAPLLAVLQETTTRVRALSTSASASEKLAVADADAAVLVAAGDPSATGFATTATGAARAARGAIATLQKDVGQATALAAQAQQAVSTWRAIHAQPPGYLGVQVASTSPAEEVHGCQTVTVEPGSPAAAAGLTGGGDGSPGAATGSGTSAAGDVIAVMTDITDGRAVWTIPDCTAFAAAMAQTRAGDMLSFTYFHQNAAGNWQLLPTSTRLATADAAGCPGPLSGHLTAAPAPGRIRLRIGLSGPGGRLALDAILNPTGADTVFPDALLRGLGYQPYSSSHSAGVVPGTTTVAQEYLYHIPGRAFTVRDGAVSASLATGMLTVVGIPGGHANDLGRGILRDAARLTVLGDAWTLTPPCS